MEIIHVDSACSDDILQKINISATDINNLTRKHYGQPILILSGTIEIDHNNISVPEKAIVCYHDKPIWFDESYYSNRNLGGIAAYHVNVRLFLFDTNEALYLALIKHELVHYIGVYTHTDTSGNVMSEKIKQEIFTDTDIELILKSFKLLKRAI